ncbi:MAG TPA: DEAD/DEAH box helicase [Candidatus Limnocylindria bacterium]|nr:DEAD/DEAH box helicase [Candidatus Limnocylindria bacterium]
MITLPLDLDRATRELGWTALTPIQELSIPPLRAGRDLLAQAQTGTGKTAAFGLPLLERIDRRASAPFALVIVPTRELAAQVAQEILTLGRHRSARVVAVYGGVGYRDQENALRRGVHIVVATPGRVIDLIDRRSLDLSKIKVLVLDEADRLLDLGFAPDIARIVARLPAGRQTALFSATLAGEVQKIAAKYTIDPASVAVRPETPAVEAIDQAWIAVREADKGAALDELLRRDGMERTLVFRRTKHGADKLVRDLARLGHRASALHGNVGQRERERVLEAFRRGTVTTLVATDLAARGIHVDEIGHVVNYDLPATADTYVHRIGRTGRAGRGGASYTFVNETQRGEFDDIRRRARVSVRQERLARVPTAVPQAVAPAPAATRRRAQGPGWARRPARTPVAALVRWSRERPAAAS